jgi:molybdopterin synthase catalytic subunit
MIRVQREDFDPDLEVARLTAGRTDAGALVTFTGLVRGARTASPLTALELEHYPGMTEKALARIEAEARRRFDIIDLAAIHRFGRLLPGERIVLVAVLAAHRAAAFDAARFLIDWLKTKAPFWKREETVDGTVWVSARGEDDTAAQGWDEA